MIIVLGLKITFKKSRQSRRDYNDIKLLNDMGKRQTENWYGLYKRGILVRSNIIKVSQNFIEK